MSDLAQRMYLAYTASSGGKNYRGDPCPAWAELPEAIRGHWQAAAGEAGATRMFPLILALRINNYALPQRRQVPWEVAEKAYAAYAAKYGTSQSMEQLAARGGFHQTEMDEFHPTWREEADEMARVRAEVERLTRERDEARRVLQGQYEESAKDRARVKVLEEAITVARGRLRAHPPYFKDVLARLDALSAPTPETRTVAPSDPVPAGCARCVYCTTVRRAEEIQQHVAEHCSRAPWRTPREASTAPAPGGEASKGEAGHEPSERVEVGARYQHFKHAIYRVIAVATEATNGRLPERVVVYTEDAADGPVWVRSEREFLDTVQIGPLTVTSRFTKVAAPSRRAGAEPNPVCECGHALSWHADDGECCGNCRSGCKTFRPAEPTPPATVEQAREYHDDESGMAQPPSGAGEAKEKP